MLLHACRCGPRGGGSRHLLDARPHRARRAGRTSDPTGTLPLQHRFTRAFDARWAQLKKMIPNAVGRTTDPVGMIHHSAMMGDDPVRAFQSWIDEAMRQLLLGVNGSWTLSYVRAAGDIALQRASGLSSDVSDAGPPDEPRDDHGRWTEGSSGSDKSQIETPAFQNWFGGSKAVDESGKPKVMYHGTLDWEHKHGKLGDFESFDRLAASRIIPKKPGYDSVGSWFSDLPDERGAGMYAVGGGDRGSIYPVFLSIKNPWRPKSFDEFMNKMHREAGSKLTMAKAREKGIPFGFVNPEPLRAWLKKSGYDGVAFKKGDVDMKEQSVWIALEPMQIKSAIGNKGTFDPSSKNIRDAAPIPLDRVPQLQTLTITELQGITEAVSQQAVRAFANGLLTKQSSSKIARDVAQVIESIGKRRTQLLVSFIVVRTFSAVTLDAFRAAGFASVGTVAERVRPSRSLPGGGLTRDAFDPNQPRRPDGKWMRTGAGEYIAFHGTTEDVAEIALKNGLSVDPSTARSFDDQEGVLYTGNRANAVFVSNKFASADWYARMRVRKVGGNPAIIELQVPKAEWKNFYKDTLTEGRGTAYTTKRIPPEWVKRVYKYTKDAQDGEYVTAWLVINLDDYDTNAAVTDAPDDNLVEVLTAGDDLVCEECQDISDEGPYELDQAEMLIPAHPRCRCAFVPWGDRRFASVRDAFDPDQPRDKDGQWTEGGGDVPSVNSVDKSAIAKIAQDEYDAWQQDADGNDEELGSGGICDRIAEGISGHLNNVETASAGLDGDDHAWVLANFKEGVYEVDIPPSVYESGGGYSWRKKPGVTITHEHVVVNKIDAPMSNEDFARKYRDEDIHDAFNPDQPRDKSGKWTAGGATEALDSLKDYLTQVAAMRGASTGAHARASVEQFVLDHGKAYTFDKSSFEGPRDQIKLCYQNAGRIAMNDASRTYVEGFISYRGIPIQHAWTVDKNNKVHDTTLRDGEGVGAYYGVPFKQEYVIKTAMKTKVWGILSHTNPSLFKDKDPKKFVQDYDPNQERDDHGRWSFGGGSGHHYSDSPAQDLLALHHSGEETMADVERQLTPGQKFAAKEAEAALAGRKPTNVEFIDPKTGTYTPERAALHAEILNSMFSKEDIAHAIPAAGQKPTLIITGGRPAAGKTSTLKGELAGADKHSFYISADTIQEYLPHYDGKVAGLFNGEAQDIALQAEGVARKAGLNITYDATLKSQQPAIDRVQTYKDAGYDVHGYFVHTAPITSAVRSAHRFMDSGRYVPPAVSFNSRTNEKTFDALIPMLDKWAIYDNNGEKPKLIARGKKQ